MADLHNPLKNAASLNRLLPGRILFNLQNLHIPTGVYSFTYVDLLLRSDKLNESLVIVIRTVKFLVRLEFPTLCFYAWPNHQYISNTSVVLALPGWC